jgi:hypothetical protein
LILSSPHGGYYRTHAAVRAPGTPLPRMRVYGRMPFRLDIGLSFLQMHEAQLSGHA